MRDFVSLRIFGVAAPRAGKSQLLSPSRRDKFPREERSAGFAAQGRKSKATLQSDSTDERKFRAARILGDRPRVAIASFELQLRLLQPIKEADIRQRDHPLRHA